MTHLVLDSVLGAIGGDVSASDDGTAEVSLTMLLLFRGKSFQTQTHQLRHSKQSAMAINPTERDNQDGWPGSGWNLQSLPGLWSSSACPLSQPPVLSPGSLEAGNHYVFLSIMETEVQRG